MAINLTYAIDQTMFKDTSISKEELIHRLDLLVSVLNLLFIQIQETQLANVNITTTTYSTADGGNVIRYGFNVGGQTVEMAFKDGKLLPS